MLESKNLNKSYKNNHVLKNINLTIKENAITSIIGPNGAGKSTLLGLISRTLKREEGKVHLEGKDILSWDRSELSKQLSILKQSGIVSTRITIKDLVSFGRYPYTKGHLKEEDHIIIESSLAYMDLIELQDRYLDELSGGQRQRAYIASLLSQDTKYILLDEPLNNLDMKYAADLLKLLRRLVLELKKTIVIVIHDINIASSYSDYIALLKDGEIVIYDEVNKVIDEEILESVYQMEFKVRNLDGRKICTYY